MNMIGVINAHNHTDGSGICQHECQVCQHDSHVMMMTIIDHNNADENPTV